MAAQRWRLHAIVPRTRANGPGLRSAIWVQGCTLGCPDCCNPGTHAATTALTRDPLELANSMAAAPGIEGVTISGGEPLQQPRALLVFLSRLRAITDLSVLVFSGYTRTEIEAQPLGPPILGMTDVLIDGRYQAAGRLGRGLRGSANQRIWFLGTRYGEADIARVPDAEVQLRADGSWVVTGIGL